MRRSLLLLLPAAVLAWCVAGARAAEDGPKAILAAAIKAHGGEEKLAKFQAGQSKTKGKLNVPGVGESDFTEETSYMLPDKFKAVTQLEVANNKLTITTIANGDKVSIDANGMEVPITDSIKKALTHARYVMKAARLASLLKDKDIELAPLGEVMVEGKPAVGVRVSSKGHNDLSLFFDKQTHLLAKMESRTVDSNSGKEITEERVVLEYGPKDKEGFAVPKKVMVKHDGEKFLEAEVVESKFLEKLDEGEFKK
jgi:hypothetical protein